MDSMLPPPTEVPSSHSLAADGLAHVQGTIQKSTRRRQTKQQGDSAVDSSSAAHAAAAPSPRSSRRDRNNAVKQGVASSTESNPETAAEPGVEDEDNKSGEEVDGKKMFQCKGFGSCRMSFSRSEHLARHIRKHTGERPFKCHCGRDFSRLDNLRQHAQTVHSDQAEKNADMMQRLQSVHSQLSATNRAKRTKTTSTSNASNRSGSNPSPPPPAMAPLPVNTAPPHQQMHSGAPYYNPVPTDFAPQDYAMRQHQMMDPYYENDGGYPSYALYPADFNMPGRPTLPPISALIPRQGVSAAPQNASLLPSPLPPSAQIYAGHTSPVYAYPDAVSTSPRSAGHDGNSQAAAAMGAGHPHHAYSGTPSPISPSRMQHQQAHHAPQPMLHMDEYGNQYYAMPPGLPGLEDQPGSPFVPAPHQGGSGGDADSQHGGINDLLHAATTAVTPGMPNAEFFSGPPAHPGGPPMRASVSPMPPSHYGTPSGSPGPHQHPYPQRRNSPGKRPRQEGEAEYLEQLNESGAYFKRPMLATV